MSGYVLRRVLLSIPTLIGVAILTFFMLRVLPGDIVEIKLRSDGEMCPRRQSLPNGHGSVSTSPFLSSLVIGCLAADI